MLGYSHEQLNSINASKWQLYNHPDDRQAVLEQLQSVINGDRSFFECESRKLKKDGSWVWVLDRGRVSERNIDGEPIRMSGTSSDISKRKQADKVKSEFVSTVSHELRTPLTSIKGSLGLIRSGVLDDAHEKIQSMLNIAYNNSERLLLLINDILDIEKMEAGKMAFNFTSVNVKELIDEALEASVSYAEQYGISFVCSDLPSDILVKGDEHRLIQVLFNLMSNAVKFSPQGVKIYLTVSIDSDFVQISVKDKGAGIPEEYRDRLFEKFTQADSSDTRKSGGTGLGLSIVKTIIEKHHGAISYDTEVGKGTTFYFTLPIIDDQNQLNQENFG